MQAVTCLKRVMVGMKSNGTDYVQEQTPSNSTTVICTLVKITGALERCIESNKAMNDVLNGKMKCTTCGATSVGLLSDCHDSATSTTTTVSHRSSEEPPRRKPSAAGGDHDDEELECSSIESRSIRSVSSSVHTSAEDDETNQTMMVPTDVADVINAIVAGTNGSSNSNTTSSSKSPQEEEEEHDLVMKSILSTTTSTSNTKLELSEKLENPLQDTALLDQFLQASLLGQTPTVTPASEENEEDKEQNAVLTSFLQILFANQQAGNAILDAGSSENDGSTSSSQPSPPADPTASLDSLAMFESLLAESMNGNVLDANTSSADQKAAARKRKSTPMKVPKSENGAGYICPMDGCNKVFKEKGSVHRHFVTHIGMRFNCDKCKASYTQKHALMLHQKIHANPDAYQCRGCGTNYTTQNGLRLHRQRNPACMEVSNALEFNTSLNTSISEALSGPLSKNSSPTKQMVSAP